MFRIALINMPFASVELPSIALTQLRTRVQQRFPGRAEADVFYLNHDVTRELGADLYEAAGSLESITSGVGDWFFRPAAFPEVPDEVEAFSRRSLRTFFRSREALREPFLEHRLGAERMLVSLIDRYELDRYDLVGFTSMFIQNMAIFAMARLLKERNPETVVVMGGANCETPMGEVLARHAPMVDYVFSGPALVSFPRLLECLMAGDRAGCEEIRGCLSRSRAETRPSPEVGDELPIEEEVPLDYDGFLASFDEKLPAGRFEPHLLFETSRGCWWGERSHCTFCGLNGLTMKYRGMPIEMALRQFQDLFRYVPRVTRFSAVDNIMPREYLTDLFPHLEPPHPDVSLFYEVKADLKDHEMETLARAGVRELQPGIEALNSSTLKLMRKGTTALNNLRFLKNSLINGIDLSWNLLVGFPGEEVEVYEKYERDLPLLTHLQPPSGVFPVRFDRFSPYFTAAAEFGLELEPYDFYGMLYPFPDEEMTNLAYYFANRNYRADYLSGLARWLPRLEATVAAWRARWRGDEPPPRLELCRRGDEPWVYDSRGDEPVEHPLDEEECRVLEILDRPSKVSRLADKADLDVPATERVLARLGKLGLLFSERDLYSSLVMEERPALNAVLGAAGAGRRAPHPSSPSVGA